MDPTRLSPIYFTFRLSYHVFFFAYITTRHHFALLPTLHTAHISLDIPSPHIALLDILDIITFHLESHHDEDVAFFGGGQME